MTVTVNEISPQPRVVIIAVDDSIHSYHAVTWAKLNAVQASDKVHLITVHIPNDYPPSIAGSQYALPMWRKEEEKRVAVSENMLRKYALQLLNRGSYDSPRISALSPELSITTKVLTGPSVATAKSGPAIVKYAVENKADVVVVGSRGLGSIQSNVMGLFGLGSVSDYLVHNMHCPVMVVRTEHAHSPGEELRELGTEAMQRGNQRAQERVVVVAVDDSKFSYEALAWVKTMLQPNDQVHLVSVLQPKPMPTTLGNHPPELAMAIPEPTSNADEIANWKDEQEQYIQLLEEVLQKCARELAHDDQVPVSQYPTTVGPALQVHMTMRVLCGEAPGVTLVEYARDKKANMVVVGSRGLGSIERNVLGLFGLGSVSDYLMHHLHCPTVVVKTHHPDTPAEQLRELAAEMEAQCSVLPSQAQTALEESQPTEAKRARVVLLAVDESTHSAHAVAWAASHLVQADDHVHLATVLAPQKFPPSIAGSDYALPMWEQEEVARVGKAELMLQTYARKLLDRFPEVTLLTQVLMDADMPEAGPAMVRYAHIKQVDIAVVGSRGLGSIQNQIYSIVGLGSVSDYLVQHLHCPALVVKADSKV